ncbi:MAG: hypothetical protein LLG04_00430 [Parachlamydia sp.]|nr:hypothetical protein [Parachlamydia sp.]
MNPVSLFDCVTGQGWMANLCNRSLFIDGISNRLGNRRYRVLRTEGLKSYLLPSPCRFSLLATVLKLALICTLAFPLFMLIIKRRDLNRRQFQLHSDKKKMAAPAVDKVVKRPAPQPKIDFILVPARPAAVPLPLILPQVQLPQMTAWPTAKAMEPLEPAVKSLKPDPASLRSTVKAFAGFLDGWKILEEEVALLSDSDIERQWSKFQTKVADLLSQTLVPKVMEAYRSLRLNYPKSSLFPLLNLADSKGDSVAVDRFLATHASPVLAAACRSGMREAQGGNYVSGFLDEGLLQPAAAFIQKLEEPRLNLKQLMAFYKTSDHLQMASLESCRRKLCQRLLYDRALKFDELLGLWSLAEEHRDGSLRFCCLHHIASGNIEYALPQALEQSFDLYQHLRPSLKHIEIGEQGKLLLTFSNLNREQIEGLQRIGIERLTVQSLFDTVCAQGFQSITNLTLAVPRAKIGSQLISSLIRQGSSLRILKIGYGTLDDDAAQALSHSLGHLNSLALLAVDLSQQGLQALATRLKTNRSLTFLQMSHGTLDENKWRLLAQELPATLKNLCICDNRLSPESVNSSAIFLTKIMISA